VLYTIVRTLQNLLKMCFFDITAFSTSCKASLRPSKRHRAPPWDALDRLQPWVQASASCFCTLCNLMVNLVTCDAACRSQWPRGVRHEPSSPARTLGSWVRIPLPACMSVCDYSVFVLFCVYVAALRWADPSSKESYRLCIGPRN
jgi:hypothetical protein